MADQIRNAAERLDVQPGRSGRSHNEKEEPHRLAVYRIVWYRRWTDTAHESQLGDTSRPRMRNGDPEADARTATGFTLLNGFEYLSIVAAGPLGEMPGKLSDHTSLVTSRHRHDDLVRAEDLGQEHGALWDGMRPKLNRANKACNALVYLSLAALV